MCNSRVLFVDDNFLSNMSTCEFLQDNAFNIIAVYCASAAFEVIDTGERLSALVTDIDLGPGAGGFDVARHARAADPSLPVVYISGTAWRRQASEGVEGSQFIAKPFDPRQIMEALDRAERQEAVRIPPRGQGSPGSCPSRPSSGRHSPVGRPRG